MPDVFNPLISAFKRSLDARLLLYCTVIIVLYTIGSFLVQIIFLNVPLMVVFSGLLSQAYAVQNASGIESAVAGVAFLESVWRNLPFILVACAVMFSVYAVAITFVESIIFGRLFNLAKAKITGAAYSLESLWGAAGKRFFVLFKAMVVISAISLVPGIVIGIPVAFAFLGFFSSLASMSAESIAVSAGSMFFWIIITAIAYFVAFLLLAPLFLLGTPIALFEKLGAIDSVKKSIAIARKQYLSNLAFIVLYGLAIAGVALFFFFVFLMLALLAFLLLNVFAFFLLLPVIYIAMFVFLVWANAFSSLAVTEFYLQSAGIKAAAKPKRRKRK